ncbi:Short-chain dehydrogenase/reductase family protein [gamma proteobacterium HdN1]|nr:Short-chain dehydrogenase/reductase family protein [gamma proteobacterium HdN1]
MQNSRVTLITGCSSGISRKLALKLKERGHHVYAGGNRWESVKTLKDLGITPIELDLESTEQCNEAVETIVKAEGRLDVLVNNTCGGLIGPLIELDDAQIEHELSASIHSILRMVRPASQPMIQQHSGLIVNVGSLSGILVTPFSGMYCASKAAVHALSDALRMELAPFHINVMTVQPNTEQTGGHNHSVRAQTSTQRRGSRYALIEKSISSCGTSKKQEADCVDVFCTALAETIQDAPETAVFRHGFDGYATPILAGWTPTRIRDWWLRRQYSLHKLK